MNKIAKNVKIFGELDEPYLALPKYFHIFNDFIEGDITSTYSPKDYPRLYALKSLSMMTLTPLRPGPREHKITNISI